MATLTYYVNTDAATDGNGSSGSPFKTLVTFWNTTLGAPGDTLIAYCSGVANDTASSFMPASGNKYDRTVRVVGNATSGKYDADKYTIDCSSAFLNYSGVSISAGLSHTWEKLQATTPRQVIANVRAGALRVNDCLLFLKPSGTYYTVINSDLGYKADIVLTNCVISDALAAGNVPCAFDQWAVVGRATGAGSKISLYNCIIHLTKMTGQAGNFAFMGAVTQSQLLFKNCFLFHDVSDSLVGDAQCTLSNCLISNGVNGNKTNVTTVSGTAYDVSTQFNNWTAFDYSLKSTATDLVDKGINVSAENGGISTDITGAARGAIWDIGPHEYIDPYPYPNVHDVTDISQAGDPECIYNSQTPAIVVGNQVSYKATTEANGWPVSIDTQGFPIIDAGGSTGTDSFKFNIGRSGAWDPVPPASNTWTFTIAPPGPPVLLTVNNGNPIQAGQTNVPYTGTGFGASPSTRTVWLTQGSVEVVQTQVTGNDTGGTFNVVGYETGGPLKYGQAEIKVTVP